MLIIGCDFHTRFQQIAMLDPGAGEISEHRLEHANGEAEAFYRSLSGPGLVGMEATGYADWFQEMLAKQGHELCVGNSVQIRAAMVRKQKTDTRDASHILDMLVSNRFSRVRIPTPLDRDARQLIRHRHKLVLRE